MRLTHIPALALALAVPAAAQDSVSQTDRLLHERILTLDTHLDTPVLFERPGWKFEDWHAYEWDNSQVDIPRMQAGRQDRIIPPDYATDYERRMRAAGDDVRVRMLDHTGHVELIAPETEAWAAAVEEIQKALRR